MKKIAGINGFGRFGLHLIKYWLDRAEESSFSISYINDDFLNIDHIHQILLNDKAVFFNKYKIKKIGSTLRFLKADGTAYEIVCSNSKKDEILLIAKSRKKIEKILLNKEVIKVVYVPNKILSIVVK